MAGKKTTKPKTDAPVDGNPDDQQEDDAPEGFTTMYGPEDCGGITIDGESYEVVDGAAYIQNEHIDEARIHGFTTKQPK